MTLFVVGKLDAWRVGDQQVKKELLAMCVGEWCFQPRFFGAVRLKVEEVVMNRCVTDAAVLDGFQCARVRQIRAEWAGCVR